jgi:hypothetical protein
MRISPIGAYSTIAAPSLMPMHATTPVILGAPALPVFVEILVRFEADHLGRVVPPKNLPHGVYVKKGRCFFALQRKCTTNASGLYKVLTNPVTS